MTHFEKEMLRLMAMMNDKLNSMGERLAAVQQVVVSTAEDVSTVRSRLIEEASRNGEAIRRQQREVRELGERVDKLEVA